MRRSPSREPDVELSEYQERRFRLLRDAVPGSEPARRLAQLADDALQLFLIDLAVRLLSGMPVGSAWVPPMKEPSGSRTRL